jgi:hypothetical protein
MLVAGHIGFSWLIGKLINRYGLRGKWLTNRLWILLLGALFPDMIDKPLGLIIHNGRAICHTLLLFGLLLVFTVWWTIKNKRPTWTIFTFGWLMHLLLDRIWLSANTFFWPLYGPFAVYAHQWFFWRIILDPATYIPELIGSAIIVLMLIFRSKRAT